MEHGEGNPPSTSRTMPCTQARARAFRAAAVPSVPGVCGTVLRSQGANRCPEQLGHHVHPFGLVGRHADAL